MSESHQYIYMIRPVRIKMLVEGLTDREEEILARHYEYLSELSDRGVVEFAGRTDTDNESTFGIVVFYAQREEDARKIMQSDPAVAEGVMVAELYPFRLAITSSK
jgi:uncharacterized protein YciI